MKCHTIMTVTCNITMAFLDNWNLNVMAILNTLSHFVFHETFRILNKLPFSNNF